jgi:hypothetical protein
MEIREAVMAFSQSEKIKSGIIWISTLLGTLEGEESLKKSGIEGAVKILLGMTIHEVALARNMTGDQSWSQVEKELDRALVMMNSGIASESISQLTRALSVVTTMGDRSMTLLMEKGVI